MAVVINQLEQLPPGGDGQQQTGTPAVSAGTATSAPAVPQPAQVMAVIRREASRAARLWAD
jgi:hypothetical protein